MFAELQKGAGVGHSEFHLSEHVNAEQLAGGWPLARPPAIEHYPSAVWPSALISRAKHTKTGCNRRPMALSVKIEFPNHSNGNRGLQQQKQRQNRNSNDNGNSKRKLCKCCGRNPEHIKWDGIWHGTFQARYATRSGETWKMPPAITAIAPGIVSTICIVVAQWSTL